VVSTTRRTTWRPSTVVACPLWTRTPVGFEACSKARLDLDDHRQIFSVTPRARWVHIWVRCTSRLTSWPRCQRWLAPPFDGHWMTWAPAAWDTLERPGPARCGTRSRGARRLGGPGLGGRCAARERPATSDTAPARATSRDARVRETWDMVLLLVVDGLPAPGTGTSPSPLSAPGRHGCHRRLRQRPSRRVLSGLGAGNRRRAHRDRVLRPFPSRSRGGNERCRSLRCGTGVGRWQG